MPINTNSIEIYKKRDELYKIEKEINEREKEIKEINKNENFSNLKYLEEKYEESKKNRFRFTLPNSTIMDFKYKKKQNLAYIIRRLIFILVLPIIYLANLFRNFQELNKYKKEYKTELNEFDKSNSNKYQNLKNEKEKLSKENEKLKMERFKLLSSPSIPLTKKLQNEPRNNETSFKNSSEIFNMKNLPKCETSYIRLSKKIPLK